MDNYQNLNLHSNSMNKDNENNLHSPLIGLSLVIIPQNAMTNITDFGSY